MGGQGGCCALLYSRHGLHLLLACMRRLRSLRLQLPPAVGVTQSCVSCGMHSANLACPTPFVQVVNYDVPWLSPLVPWQPAEEPVQIGAPASEAPQQQQQQQQPPQSGEELQDEEERPRQEQEPKEEQEQEPEEEQEQEQEGAVSSRRRLAAAKKAPARAPPPPPPPGPPPTPPGAEATALLAALDQKLSSLGYPRHVCIQVGVSRDSVAMLGSCGRSSWERNAPEGSVVAYGSSAAHRDKTLQLTHVLHTLPPSLATLQGKLENSRRNYTAAFEAIRCECQLTVGPACGFAAALEGSFPMVLTLPNPQAHQLRADFPASSTCPFLCSHPAVLHHLRTSGERLLLLGHRSKWETVIIPDEVADVVVVLESLPYTVCVVPWGAVVATAWMLGR